MDKDTAKGGPRRGWGGVSATLDWGSNGTAPLVESYMPMKPLVVSPCFSAS